ncbi:MAG: hypothetical protein JWQ71_4332 [Pedosphaera sp.]|nr:hypothetical protein [Pedosphaera sp.]
MKLSAITLLALGLFLTLDRSLAQGNLTPASFPAPSMKTLDQIEPRTPISSLPFSASTSGSYYVTTNLISAVVQSGIIIGADNVTIDLNGFTVDGGFNKTNIFGFGITSGSSRTNIYVYNGMIRNWGGGGVYALTIYNSRFENLRLSENGVGMYLGSANQVLGCSITGTTAANTKGISVVDGCLIKDCILTTNVFGIVTGNGCTIMNCTARANASGIQTGFRNIVKGCSVTENTGIGISVGGECLIVDNICNRNGGTAIAATSTNNRLDGNQVRNNTGIGIQTSAGAGNVVIRNSSSANSGGNYSPASGVGIAPIQDPSTATNPFANF